MNIHPLPSYRNEGDEPVSSPEDDEHAVRQHAAVRPLPRRDA